MTPTHIHYGHLARTESMDTILRENLQKIEKYLDEKDRPSFTVWVDYKPSPTSKSGYEFTCKIEVHMASGRSVFAEKTDDSFAQSVTKTRRACLRLINRVKGESKERRLRENIRRSEYLA